MELNKIYNGDAYELIKQIPDKSVDLIYTDIPYLYLKRIGTTPTKLSLRIENQYKNLIGKNIADGIDYKILDDFVRVMKHIYIYIWCSKDQIFDLMKYFIEQHNCRVNILCWCKTNPTPATNNNWLPNIEYCLVFKDENAPRYNDGYEIKSKWYMSPINQADKQLYNHPTIKPYEMVKKHLLHSTNKGDVVLDPFVGSGTTCVVARDLERQFIGFEIDKDFYKIAQDRLDGIDQKGQIHLF